MLLLLLRQMAFRSVGQPHYVRRYVWPQADRPHELCARSDGSAEVRLMNEMIAEKAEQKTEVRLHMNLIICSLSKVYCFFSAGFI